MSTACLGTIVKPWRHCCPPVARKTKTVHLQYQPSGCILQVTWLLFFFATDHCVVFDMYCSNTHCPLAVASISKPCLPILNVSMRISSCSHRKSKSATNSEWTSFNSSLNISMLLE